MLGGAVQYVGLRYRVREAARARRIKGHVKNMSDGTVEIVCEGEKDDIGGLVGAVKSFEEPARVESIRAEYSECRHEFAAFRIVREGPGGVPEELPDDEMLSEQMDVLISEATRWARRMSLALSRT